MSAIGGSNMMMPGWYPDPDDVDLERFWDGDNWTAKARQAPLLKMPPPAPRHGSTAVRPTSDPVSGVVVAGYVCAVVFPLLGFILGLTQINRSHHGLRIVLGSVGVALFYYYFLLR